MIIECVSDNICRLGECPVWNAANHKLYWTDILQRRIWEYSPAAGATAEFWQGEMMVGGFALTRDGGMVFCADQGVFKLSSTGALAKLFDFAFQPGERFNDITTDPAGRIFAGTLRPDRRGGVLYRLERGRPPVPVITGIGISNGMAFSMDLKKFFHTDSLAMTITSYDYDIRSGAIANPEIFFQSTKAQGLPDGITTDREDHVWAAFWGGGCVRRISPAGQIINTINLPAKNISSLIFGGADLRDLYITTACQGGAGLEHGLDAAGNFPGGPTYRCRPGAQGRAEWPADF